MSGEWPQFPRTGVEKVFLHYQDGRAPMLCYDKYPDAEHVAWFPYYGDQQTKVFSSVALHNDVLYIYDQSPEVHPEDTRLTDFVDALLPYRGWEAAMMTYEEGYDGAYLRVCGWREMLPWEYTLWREDYHVAALTYDDAADFNNILIPLWVT